MFFRCCTAPSHYFLFFFFNDTATTEIYTLSLHDALPISAAASCARSSSLPARSALRSSTSTCAIPSVRQSRSEEHTSELQSHLNLVCRLLLEKKKNTTHKHDQWKLSLPAHEQDRHWPDSP